MSCCRCSSGVRPFTWRCTRLARAAFAAAIRHLAPSFDLGRHQASARPFLREIIATQNMFDVGRGTVE